MSRRTHRAMMEAALAPGLAIVLALVPLSPTAALCTYYEQYLHWEQGLDTPDWAAGIATAGNFAYVADGESGLRILDISDPDTPVWAGSLDTPGSAADLALTGSLACLADLSGGLRLIDVSNPSAPASVGALATPFPVSGVAVAGTYAYVSGGGAGGTGLLVVDISDPASPSIVTTIPGSAVWRRVAVAGSTLYVAAESQGLRIYSLANPASPAFLGATPDFNSASDVAVDGTIAYIRSGNSLKSVDVSNPASPTILDELGAGPGTGVAISGGHAFVSTLFDAIGSLMVVDIDDPTALALTGTINLRDWAMDVALRGDHAFVANGTNGVQVIDVSNPTEPPIIGSLFFPENRKVELVGQRACVIDALTLKMIDVSNPELPVLMGSVGLSGSAFDLAVSGLRAYVGVGSSLRIVDLTVPSLPSVVGSLTLSGSILGVAVKGGLAFLAESSSTSGKLHVVDVSNPASPALLASVATPKPANDVAVAGNVVYLTTSTFFPDNSEFKVFDVSNPASPSLVETLALPGIGVYDLAAAGKQAYIVGPFGMIGIDASDPSDPVIADGAPTSTLAVQVTVAGAKAYVGCYHTNFTGSYQVVDISNPHDLAILGNRFTPGTTSGIATDGTHLFLAGDEYGFLVLPAECATAATVDPAPPRPKTGLTLGPPRPNPIRSGEGTLIAFDLARPMRASLTIYDVAGRQIRLLENRQLAAGANRAWWDGRGDRGEVVAAGIYFCRLETSAGTASRRIVRIH